jgi:hypothetical protein
MNLEEFMELLLSLFSGSLGAGILIWLFRGWISERLKQSIQHEYSEKLESYKTDLNSKIEAIKHDNQVSQLRTSLFFDHQRNAFAALITKIAQINKEWIKKYSPETGLYAPVPYKQHKELEELFYEHQLFLDDDCLLAMTLAMDAYFNSLPYDDGSGAPPHQCDAMPILEFLEYLQPRMASIFRSKIGVQSDLNQLRELAILAAMKLVNSYHFIDVDIPPKGILRIKKLHAAVDMVSLGEANFEELNDKLKAFDEYLNREGKFFHEAQFKVKQCLRVLEKMPNKI